MNPANNHCILAIKKMNCLHDARTMHASTSPTICKPANNLQIINPSSTPHFIQKKKTQVF